MIKNRLQVRGLDTHVTYLVNRFREGGCWSFNLTKIKLALALEIICNFCLDGIGTIINLAVVNKITCICAASLSHGQ